MKNLKSTNPHHMAEQLDNLLSIASFLAAALERVDPSAANITVPVEQGSKIATGLVNAVAGIISGDVSPAPAPAAAEGSITAPAAPATATVDPAMLAAFAAFMATQKAA
jgi:hypothetical protein